MRPIAGKKFLDGHWLGEQIALGQADAGLNHRLHIQRIFHAFGHYFSVEFGGELCDRTQHRLR